MTDITPEGVDPEDMELEEFDTAISDHYGYIIDESAKMMQWSRGQVQVNQMMANRLRALSDEFDHIAGLHAIAARKMADFAADTISTEYSIIQSEPDEEEYEENDEDNDS